MFLTIGVIIVAVALTILGALTYIRSNKQRVNVAFAAFSIVLAFWLTANYIGANYKTWLPSRYFAYGDFILGPWAGYLFAEFVIHLRVLTVHRRLNAKLRAGLLITAIVCSFIPLLKTTIRIETTPAGNHVNYGPLYDVYSILLGLIFVFGLVVLFRSWRQAKGLARKQLITMLWGLFIAALFISIANLVVPQLTKSSVINLAAGNISYLSIVFFVSLSAVTIVRHRLFDIRFIVAKSFAYLVVITILASVYAVLVYSTLQLLPIGTSPQFKEAVYLVSSLFVGFTFQPLRRRFDRISSRLFYRDAYDAQLFLDELNKTLASEVQIEALLHKSSRIMEENLKSEFCNFFIRGTPYMSSRLVGEHPSKLTQEESKHLEQIVPKNEQKALYVEDLSELDKEKELTRFLKSKGIEVLLRIRDASAGGQDDVGYLLIGAKKSGNLYNKQDLQILEIIANELVIAIENALRFEEIEQFNVTLQQKVSDATRELRRTNEKLKALDEAKDEFISMASHQLRTPLTSVKGYLSMLDEGDAGNLNDNQKKFVNQAFLSSQRMVYLIADLLNVSRLKTGKFIIEPTPVFLPDLVESEIAQLYETVKSRGITMDFDKPKEFPILKLDETKIRQVVMNFTDNAIYYTPTGGKIKIALTETPSNVEFTVTDDGIGVPKADQHHLFTKFYRAGNARKSRPDGTGLGLFMAQKVVVAQGGAIIFKSQEGKGSTFGFTFAKDKLELPATAMTPAK